MDPQIQWPQKTREFQTFLIDSTYWNDFAFRDDDIIVSTYGKAGPTVHQNTVILVAPLVS